MEPGQLFQYQHGGRPSIIIDSSDHWQHRLSRLRRPLYSETELGLLAMGWTLIATVALIVAFPC